MIYVPMVIALLSWTDAFAGAKTYGATKGDNLVCIYLGAGKSSETIVTGKDDRCPGAMMVPYAPNPDYDWKETLKKMQKDY